LFFTTANVTAPDVPPDVDTVTLRLLADALFPIVNVAVICVALTTVTLLTDTPPPLTATVAPDAKFEPVNVTATAVPCVPELGAIEVSVGAGGAGTVIVTLAVPTAEGASTLVACTVTVPPLGTNAGAV